jgi:centromere protein X
VKDEAVVATAEVLRLFAEEITARAAETAIMDGDDTVDGGHLERILPQLMLDFAT